MGLDPMSKQDEIRKVIDRVGATFSKLDFDGWIDCFHSPHTVITADSILSPTDHEESKRVLQPMFDNMKKRNFKCTILETCNIRLLSDTTAIVSTVWSRMDVDDNLMEKLGATYLLLLTQGDWKIAVVTGHDADVIVVSSTEQK